MLANLLSSLFVVGNVATPTPTPAVLAENKSAYTSSFFHVYPDQKLHLLPNFEKKLSTGDLAAQHGCVLGVNGGFYSETNMPIGWFVSRGTELNKSQKNQLFNGFIYRFENGKASIAYNKPEAEVVSGLQTGPMLMMNGEKNKLSLVRDKQARRMVAAVTRSGDLVFISFYRDTSPLDGPLLAELPQLVYDFEQEHKFDITAAVNLDGGAASGFVNNNTTLDEWQSVGSWWCVTDSDNTD